MAESNRPSLGNRIKGLSFVMLGGAGIYASSFSSGMDETFMVLWGLFFGIPGLVVLVRGY